MSKIDVEALGTSRFLNLLAKLPIWAWDNRLRRLLHDPTKLLQGAGIRPGQSVLEVGCGSGFFTLPAAEIIGPTGRLIAMDPMKGFVEAVREKVRDSGHKNVEILRRDALNTRLETGSVDVVLLFGVVPFPTLPLDKLLPEMDRILRPSGTLALWQFPFAAGVPASILRSGLFAELGKQNGVRTYKKVLSGDTIGD